MGGNTTTLDYDCEDRLTQNTYPSTATNTFSYNGLDTRVGKVDSAGTATYLRDGAGVTAPVINDGTANYTPGVSERRSGNTKFVNADRLGSTTHLTDATEATTDSREYDAYGQTVSSTGSTATPFGFVGKAGYQQDADSGLMLLGHRYYDASTGRFITRDRVKKGRNWYSYSRNDPVRFTDPSGFEELDPWQRQQVIDGAIFLRRYGYVEESNELINMLNNPNGSEITIENAGDPDQRARTTNGIIYLNNGSSEIWYDNHDLLNKRKHGWERVQFDKLLLMACTLLHELNHRQHGEGDGRRWDKNAGEKRCYTAELTFAEVVQSRGTAGQKQIAQGRIDYLKQVISDEDWR